MDTQTKQILEEIDRRIEMYFARNDGARAEALSLLRDEITGSITKEETETELEKAAEEYEHERVYESELARYCTYLETLEDGESPKMRMPSRDTEYFLNADIIESFKAGAGWQKRKMVGSAFEGGAYSYRNGYIHVSCDIDENTTDIKLGDRVKLIVVPVK